MTELVVHKGGWTATEEDVKAAAVPVATASYTPVPNSRFIEEVRFNLSRFGLKEKQSRFALAREGKQLFGVLDLTNGAGASDWSLALGLRNSYDSSISLGLVAGSRVFVCDNLAFSGEVQASRKHAANIFRDMPSMIYGMLDKCVAHRRIVEAEILGMKDLTIDDRTAHDLMVRAVDKDVVPVSTLPHVLKEWREPTFPDFMPRTAWSLFNAFTFIQQRRSPQSQMDDTLRLTRVFRETLSIN